MIPIALDAMGGDHAPDEIVRAAAEVSLSPAPLSIVLVGESDLITERLGKLRHDPERISVHHASQRIDMHDSAGAALAAKPDASILVGARLGRQGGGTAPGARSEEHHP